MLQKRAGRREIVRLRGDGDSLVEPEGTFDFVTILDFGAAKYLDQAMAGSGVVIGTPTYMAPETARDGVADARSDIYARGGGVLRDVDRHACPSRGTSATEIMLKHVREPVHPAAPALPGGGDHRRRPSAPSLKALAKRPGRPLPDHGRAARATLEHCYGSGALPAQPGGAAPGHRRRGPAPADPADPA